MPYLDHAGSTLPSKIQLEEVAKQQSQLILANPHSHHATAVKTKQIVNSARLRILQYFNTTSDDYFVVLTNNTTHGLKIVAENFKFGQKTHSILNIASVLHGGSSNLGYLYDSHHSVVGLRHVVNGKVNSISCVNEESILEHEIPDVEHSLFVLTAMSNFCGKKYSLESVHRLQEKGWAVCLDAASFVSSSALDLSQQRPNFIAFSFYKIFGYPTGIGALLVRKDSAHLIEKTSFAGGTVQSVDEMSMFFVLREFERAFEEGTLNYYGIAQLQKGFEEIERCGGISSIRNLTHHLCKNALYMLKSKKHPNGRPVVEIYSQSEQFENPDKQGPIVAFNLKRPDGGYYGYTEVEKMCAIFGIELRTGCFCNIGACKKYLGITSEMIQENMSKGKRCGDEIDLINGTPTGAIRISFGRTSTEHDITALEQMIDTCFTEGEHQAQSKPDPMNIESYSPTVVNLFSFPIKSVGSVGRKRYELTARGFKNDREFLIVNDDVTLNLKTHPELCMLTATIVDDDQLLIQTFDQNENLVLPMSLSLKDNGAKLVCKNTIATMDCGDKVGKWLDNALDRQNCRLLRVAEDSKKNFVNDSPFLLINEASVYMLSRYINMEVREILTRFRSNIVVRGLPPFIEDTAKRLSIENLEFEVVDKCTRCEMICVDPMTGEKDPSLLLALRDYRNKQKMTFGIYIRQTNFESGQYLESGMSVNFSTD
ncbi:Molybdenum cofactor sulfurase [Caenorhabditis elegans]|uniref:Molybdenum cofactor sulfurase n=1 Tax=Caenorhabditis elegans TaxID=6239 RepID=MOCOS_CAEEL|nr:Molybdenum cofactor sulfurase [Caenorhabditis elegans]Q21657.2 RecName: Full=Molybdenum cofactor sulfurase; Short=MCS; Short=MOS; Short=MoCo sulfurase; AltName: Full=Molybdenum cofactor sulfurtransferase [Caenorhabditis elegans]CAA93672.2 Molybdenum cofactor sulfurase [Caenorhabditis elegans]|eukprot:NP_510552.2 Molybdenum cofactor sulfurase [Caenorhabditis elegans]